MSAHRPKFTNSSTTSPTIIMSNLTTIPNEIHDGIAFYLGPQAATHQLMTRRSLTYSLAWRLPYPILLRKTACTRYTGPQRRNTLLSSNVYFHCSLSASPTLRDHSGCCICEMHVSKIDRHGTAHPGNAQFKVSKNVETPGRSRHH